MTKTTITFSVKHTLQKLNILMFAEYVTVEVGELQPHQVLTWDTAVWCKFLLLICLHNYLKQNNTLYMMVFHSLKGNLQQLILVWKHIHQTDESSMLGLLMYGHSMKHRSLISPFFLQINNKRNSVIPFMTLMSMSSEVIVVIMTGRSLIV